MSLQEEKKGGHRLFLNLGYPRYFRRLETAKKDGNQVRLFLHMCFVLVCITVVIKMFMAIQQSGRIFFQWR